MRSTGETEWLQMRLDMYSGTECKRLGMSCLKTGALSQAMESLKIWEKRT